MSSDGMSPGGMSPDEMSPAGMSPDGVSAPAGMSPEAMSPETTNPEAMSPEAMSPEAMGPEAMNAGKPPLPAVPEPPAIDLTRGCFPAGTKHTGSYRHQPLPRAPQRREGESEADFAVRSEREMKRKPRSRGKKGGICFAFPDMCVTPAGEFNVVLPYLNIGMLKDATGVAPKLLAENKPVLVETSELTRSYGDEAGSCGGVISGAVAGKVTFKQSSSRVLCGGIGVVYVGARTGHNNDNVIGKIKDPSQMKMGVAP